MSSARVRSARARRNAAPLAFICVALAGAPARAGHAPIVPEPRTILLRDDAPEHAVIGTRRGGYFLTRDAGETWSWLCEAGVGYEDEEVYPGVFLAGGELVVSTGFGGVARSNDGCGWSQWLPSEQPFIVDVQRFAGEPASVVALEARSEEAGYVNQLWLSRDGASTWGSLGEPFSPSAPASALALAADGEIYVTTIGAEGSALLRTHATAESWLSTVIATEAGVVPRIVGVTGAAAERRVYVLLDHAQLDDRDVVGDRLLVSRDGGDTFSLLFEASGDLGAAALSSDGERLAVGGDREGLHLLLDASDEASAMQRISARSVHALAWDSHGKLYVAGHEAADGFAVGVSDDDGATFRRFLAWCQVGGPLECAADSSVGAACFSAGETGWDVRREVAAPEACQGAPDASAPGVEASPDETAPEVRQPSPAGQGCTTPTSGDTGGLSSALCFIAGIGLYRSQAGRRRRRAKM